MDNENIVYLEHLDDLHHLKLKKKTKIIIRHAYSDWHFLTDNIERKNISGIFFEKEEGEPEIYTASEDGDMIFRNFRNREGERKKELTFCVGLKEDEVIPDGVTVIGESAFENTDIRSVKIPNTVKKIEEYAFLECKRLEEITLPPSVEFVHEESLMYSKIIHIQKPITGILKAVSTSLCDDISANYCLDYNGSLFILPRNMDRRLLGFTEEMIFHNKSNQKIHHYFKLALSDKSRMKAAYEIYTCLHDTEAKDFLQTAALEILEKMARRGENALMTFLLAYRDADLLNADILNAAMNLASGKGWIQANACILQLARDVSVSPSFEI